MLQELDTTTSPRASWGSDPLAAPVRQEKQVHQIQTTNLKPSQKTKYKYKQIQRISRQAKGATAAYRAYHANGDNDRKESQMIVRSGRLHAFVAKLTDPFTGGGFLKLSSLGRHNFRHGHGETEMQVVP